MNNLASAFRSIGSAIHDRLDRVDISPEDISEALARPGSFGYSGDRDMFNTWSLGPVIRHRDSGLLDQSNADCLEMYLSKSYPALSEEWELTSCSHWAVGWVDHISFRAVDSDGEPTPIFRAIKSWFDALSDYPIANEDDYSEREYEATAANYRTEGYGDRELKEDAPAEDWAYDVRGWFHDNDRCDCIEASDDLGGWADSEAIIEALDALGYLKPECSE